MLPLTLLMLKLEYSGITRSILWLQMLWCWIGGIKGSLSPTRKDLKHLSRNYGKCKDISISSKKFSESRVKTEQIAAHVCGHQGSGICCLYFHYEGCPWATYCVCFTSLAFLYNRASCMLVMYQGLYSLKRRRLISLGIPIINLRRSSDRLRFIMGIPIPVRRHLLSE